jgi:RHS repeat-associated protein
LTAHYEYDPYGNITVKTGTYADQNPYQFSSKYFDQETGLLYYGYRYYDSRLGRWISRDPSEEEGGINIYKFVWNNPLNWIDPNGLLPVGLDGKPLGHYDADKGVWVIDQSDYSRIYNMYNSNSKHLALDIFLMFAGELATGGMMPPIVEPGFPSTLEIAAKKTINLPSWRKITIDLEHILSGHTAEGTRISKLKNLFPSCMTKEEIEKAILEAYKNASKLATQGDRILLQGKSGKMVIEMWLNKITNTIETAYHVVITYEFSF